MSLRPSLPWPSGQTARCAWNSANPWTRNPQSPSECPSPHPGARWSGGTSRATPAAGSTAPGWWWRGPRAAQEEMASRAVRSSRWEALRLRGSSEGKTERTPRVGMATPSSPENFVSSSAPSSSDENDERDEAVVLLLDWRGLRELKLDGSALKTRAGWFRGVQAPSTARRQSVSPSVTAQPAGQPARWLCCRMPENKQTKTKHTLWSRARTAANSPALAYSKSCS
ncbi:uncharacterized protein J3D65DRAFT_309763 [Phyllosticta citribraziliensis]|uniref:Uncharacterized protein n=1 Tax=Phyllosticta citribraziliensis TaxID=989973 RepID=A0ABR1LY04_9PEZI